MRESDPSDGEIDDVEEFLREFDRVEYDETLLDLVGDGYDVNAPGDQDVADLLGAWRDRVREAPIDETRMPSAHTARGELPHARTTGGTVSISDNAAQIGQLSQDESIAGAVRQAKARLAEATQHLVGAHQRTTEIAGQAAGLLGGEDGNLVNGQGAQLAEEINRMVEAVDVADQRGDELMRFANAFRTTLADMARKHGA